ncbi:MAG: DUF692 family protein [Alphaproteobacteria bacterium]|nr:DUF692 family protein [Alphaproteobacteria bacterium]
MKNTPDYVPNLGFGLGLRPKHYSHIFENHPDVDWFEIISENFMDTGGKPRRNLARIAERYPLVMHGVAMSIGTVDPLNSEYLTKLKKLADDVKPAWISDHLCWTGIAHKNSHDLLPVPYTEEALKHIISRITQVQDFLGRPIALENPSTYLEFKTSHIPESEFIAEMAKESGCHLLLDVNNVYVTCYNHRLDPKAYIDTLPLDKVVQIHLSGHTNKGTHIIDTHDDHVVDEVWQLYKYVVNKAGRVPNTMVEWDDNIPEFDVLYAELGKAKLAAKDAGNYAPLPDLAKQEAPYVANAITPLADAQTTMQEAILQGTAIDSNPDAWIRAKAEFAPVDQLAVYVNAYRFRLYDVTAEDYSVLKHYLGDDDFDRLIKDFVNTAHSDHFNVGRYAAHLPDFIRTHTLATPFAIELATLENAISQLTDPEETIALTPAHLEGMTPDALMESVLYPRKALQLFAFEYPVNAYFREMKDEQSPTPPAAQKSYLAVFRHEDVVWRMDLEAMEYDLLSALFAGKTIGEALANVDESAAGKLSEYFSRWMRNGLLAKPEPVSEQSTRSAA